MKSYPKEFRLAAAELDEPAAPIAGATSPGAASTAPAIDLELVWDALRTVIDPEIGLDIVTLGMVYDLTAEGDALRVTFTLTTPGCPMEEHITNGILYASSAVPGVGTVEPDLVWEPRWHPGMIQQGAW
jgi:metal-sulfur cluster biosynthetic enzyme